MSTTTLEDGRASGEQWDERRRAALMKRIARGRSSVEEACKRHGLDAELVQDWLRGFRRSVVLAFDERLKQRLVDQGADAALWAAEFTGTLDEISVIDLIQSVELARKSAVIILCHNGMESRVWCSDGAVIDAECGRLRGELALYRLASLEHGRAVVEFRVAPRARTIHASTSRLLLEAAHRKDEADRLWRKLGDRRRLYRTTERAARSSTHSSPAERALLKSFQQPSSLFEVFQRSDLGDVETLTMLAQLSDNQLIAADLSSAPLGSAGRDTGDLIASFRTLTGTGAPERRKLARWRVPGWAWCAPAGLLLLSIGTWFRSVASEAPRTGPAAAPIELPPPPAPIATPPKYVAATSFEPSEVAIWLDGQQMPSGPLSTTFSKDGRAHELRVLAEGYSAVAVVFVDTPPPARIQLQPLPPVPVAAPATSAVEPLAKQRAKAPRRGRHVGGLMVRAARTPRVQTIDAATPAIQIIE
jgi:transposase-like protein